MSRVGKYLIKKEIGRGGFGVVYQGVHVDTGQQVAIKRISMGRYEEAEIRKEADILKRLSHRHIVRFFGVLKNQNDIHFVLEYCPCGDLRKIIKGAPNGLRGDWVKSFACQLGEGIRYLHKNDVFHRDLKPENILHTQHAYGGIPTIKIADFGLARRMGTQSMRNPCVSYTFFGPGFVAYMAPEILDQVKYSASADLWSVGIILYEMATGRRPFSAPNQVRLLRDIRRTGRGLRLSREVRSRISGDLCDLIEALLRTDPKHRISFDNFFAHRYLRNRGDDFCYYGRNGVARDYKSAPTPAPVPLLTPAQVQREKDSRKHAAKKTREHALAKKTREHALTPAQVQREKDSRKHAVRKTREHTLTPAQMNKKGQDYHLGRNGVAMDRRKSFKCYRKAAKQGHAEAQYNLGWCYHNGEGVPFRDYEKAIKWYRKAAAQGDSNAKRNLRGAWARPYL